jgi:hypothetical protein
MEAGMNGDPFRQAERLLAEEGVIDADPAQKTKIKLVPVISELAEQVGLVLGRDPQRLLDSRPRLFLRGDVVMKIEYDPNQGDLDFAPMKETEFVTWVERFVSFIKLQRFTEKDEHGEEVGKTRELKMSLNTKLAKLILDSPQFRACLPRVVRKNRVRLPVLRKNGRVELLPPGYDEESGVFTFPNNVVIDESWSASKAVAFLLDLLSGFPLPVVSFERDGQKFIRLCPRGIGACVASMVAPFAEGLLSAHTLRCGFIFTANQPRSGKSLLAKMAIAPITGQAAGLTLARDEESLRNRIDAALLSGQSCLFFDNVKGFIESHVIEALMTLPYWQGRTYHTQRIFTVKNETTIFISGNNATVSPDINGRFVYVELFSESADPNARTHDREIDDRWLMDSKNRSEILSALWALVRHWDSSGRPPAPNHIAGFKAWCDVVGGIVCSVTDLADGSIGNPLIQPDLASAGDKETKHMKRLIELLIEDGQSEGGKQDAECLEFEPVEVIQTAMAHGMFDWFLPELPEGKDVSEVLKQPERVRFGKLITAKSGEAPRGIKYLISRNGAAELWRFSYRGGGKTRRYLLDRE